MRLRKKLIRLTKNQAVDMNLIFFWMKCGAKNRIFVQYGNLTSIVANTISFFVLVL